MSSAIDPAGRAETFSRDDLEHHSLLRVGFAAYSERDRLRRIKLLKFARIAGLIAIAGVLCGFNDTDFIFGLNAYRGEPVRDAFARLGPPIQRGANQGQRLYYWRVTREGGYFICKIWGTARGGVMTNWGYQDCAF